MQSTPKILRFKFFILLTLIGCIASPDQDSKVVNKKSSSSSNANRNPEVVRNLTLTVLVNGGNQALDLLPAGSDPDGDELFYSIGSPTKQGTLSQCLGLNSSSSTDLSCFYEPFVGVVGAAADSFTYFILDRKGGLTSVVVFLTIKENSSPVVSGRTISILENGGTQSLGTLSPATDADGDVLSYLVTTFPSKGTLSNCMGLNGTLKDDLICDYAPDSNKYGSDSFIFSASDGRGGVTSATITLNLQSSNQNPTVSSNPYTVDVGVNLGYQTINLSSLVITDPDGVPPDRLTYTVSTQPVNGTLIQCLGQSGTVPPAPDLTCLYSPNTGVEGSPADSFYFTVTDDTGGSVVVQVKINVINLAPTGETATKTLVEDIGGSFTIAINDQGEADLSSITGISPLANTGAFTGALSNGTLTDCMGLSGSLTSTDSICTYTPNTNVAGSAVDSFIYKVLDIGGKSSTATITIALTGVNDAPTFSNQTFSLFENGGTQNFTVSPASDPDSGDTFTYTISSSPATGTLSQCMGLGGSTNTDLTCQFTPVSNLFGTPQSTFSAVATDTGSATSMAVLSINVQSTNIAPTFTINNFTVAAIAEFPNSPASTTALTSLPAAVDLDTSDTLTYSVVTAPTLGLLSSCLDRAGNGSTTSATGDLVCDYFPPVNTCGSQADFFTYMVKDNENYASTLTVYIPITCNNTAPTATASQRFNVLETLGTQVLSSIGTATDFDAGPVADVLSYSVETGPAKGYLSSCLSLGTSTSGDLDCIYEIAPSYLGTDIVGSGFDTFVYKVNDNQGGVSTQYITIDVVGVNADTTQTTIADKRTGKNTGLHAISTVVDEGGAIDENAQALQVMVAASSTLFESSSMSLYYGSSRSVAWSTGYIGAGGAYRNLGDSSTSANTKTLFIDLLPFTNATGTASITVSVLDDGAPVSSSHKTFLVTVDNVSAQHEGWTSVTAMGAKVDKNDSVISNDRTVNFVWNSMNLSSTGFAVGPTPTIAGYYVYRNSTSSADSNFDFGDPVSSSSVNSSLRNFTDTTVNSVSNATLVADTGEVFWYKVRPVLSNGAIVTTNQSYETLRVIVPPKNKALVHRWMANLDICGKIGQTPDKINNYSCSYGGPGSTASGTYDLGKDLLVDRYEIGCNYDDSPDCNGDACIGVDVPTMTSVADKIYYQRSTGKCFLATDGLGTWKTIADLTFDAHGVNRQNHVSASLDGFVDSAGTVKLANSPYLPPLAFITQLEANNYCAATDFNITINTNSGTLTGGPFSGRLLTRKEQIAASSWSSLLTDGSINLIEEGSDLSSDTGCNSSNGGGQTFYDNPISFEIDSYPATSSTSTLRMLRTGSVASRTCVSRYGIQDLVGNMREWVSDRFFCETISSCSAVHSTAVASSPFALNNELLINNTTPAYEFTGTIGPCADPDENGICNATALSEWALASTTNSAGRFYIPMGLPITSSYPSPGSTSGVVTIANTGLNIITTSQLHGDRFSINATPLTSGALVVPYLGGVTFGGSYSSTGTSAGVYNFDLIDSFNFTSSNTGFRCVTPVPNP